MSTRTTVRNVMIQTKPSNLESRQKEGRSMACSSIPFRATIMMLASMHCNKALSLECMHAYIHIYIHTHTHTYFIGPQILSYNSQTWNLSEKTPNTQTTEINTRWYPISFHFLFICAVLLLIKTALICLIIYLSLTKTVFILKFLCHMTSENPVTTWNH
jgi:uncharacterized protein (DUF2062 family)